MELAREKWVIASSLRYPGTSGIGITGDKPKTGIYEVLYDRGDRARHEVVMFGEDLFPECEECGARVRLRVIRTAPYIFDDEDFVRDDEK